MARKEVTGIPFMQVINPERGVLRQRSNCHDCERVAALYPETWPFPGEKNLHFSSQLPELEEERIISTLWGCIRRRVCRNIELQDPLPRVLTLKYKKRRVWVFPW